MTFEFFMCTTGKLWLSSTRPTTDGACKRSAQIRAELRSVKIAVRKSKF